MINTFREILCCPSCRTGLIDQGRLFLCPRCQKQYPLSRHHQITLVNFLPKNHVTFSQKKWQQHYQKPTNFWAQKKEFESSHQRVIAELKRIKPSEKNVFLEIGCGPMMMGQIMANNYRLVIGVDYSLNVLTKLRQFLEKSVTGRFLLICADIKQLPLKNSSCDLIYGGGVIEHFDNPQAPLEEIYRVLKKGGITFNSVPTINFGTGYRQLWGNVPDLPIIKPILIWWHTKVLGGNHMRFGLEFSFLPKKITRVHQQIGFKRIIINRLDIPITLEYLPQIIRKPFRKLAETNLFCPMIKIIARK